MVDKKTQLSRGLLDMKFMKKTKERVEKDADDAVGNALYSHEISERMKKKGEIIFIEASMSQCRNFTDGRLSFGGKNPAIERIMKDNEDKRMHELEKLKEKDITDVDMASQSAVADNVAKRFKTKNQRKFMKPIVID